MTKTTVRDYEENMFLLDDEDDDTQADKYLTFPMGSESYAISIGDVIEIIELEKIVSVPDVPQFVKGVINLRGKIIPVMDLRLRFHLEERVYDDRTCIVIIEVEEMVIGVIVDTVTEVVLIPEDQVEEAPRFKQSENDKGSYIKGLGKHNDQVKIILDVEKILFEKDLAVMESIKSK